MSRAADAQSKKKDQKAEMAATRDRKAELLAMGLTSTMKKQIGDDRLLCTVCGATSRGPIHCECRGGSSKPGTGYDATQQLIDAAKLRHESEKQNQQEKNQRQQAEKEKERGKRREGRGEVDLDAEYDEVDGVEIRQVITFPIGKLGFDIERNVVISAGGAGGEMGVRVGYVICEVEGTAVRPDKKAIIAAVTKVFRNEKKPCRIKFRCPIEAGATGGEGEGGAAGEAKVWYCFRCEKFLESGAFDVVVMGAKNAGQRGCSSCEECADMFDDDEEDY
mmetsp:Transcript_7999/g.19217  ORF Transcript_7999/g.19217 Transcript_7999/m.19217 type:complete len:277 (+) Transcript_7999:39-869(+)|eukprot:g4619.t1